MYSNSMYESDNATGILMCSLPGPPSSPVYSVLYQMASYTQEEKGEEGGQEGYACMHAHSGQCGSIQDTLWSLLLLTY